MATSVRERAPWQDRATCAVSPLALLDWDGGRVTEWHRQTCALCPVRVECAVDALERPVGHGTIRAGVACQRSTRRDQAATDDALHAVLASAGVEVVDG